MRSRAALLLAVPLLAAGLATEASRASAGTTSWPTYHLDPGRGGNDTGEPSFGGLGTAWTTGGLDGTVFAEPVDIGSTVVVATEHNSLYGFNSTSGAVLWGPVHLGAPRTSNFPCGDINPLGITGTPVIDGGYIYVVAEVQASPSSFAFHLAKVNPSNGAVVYNNNITPAGMDSNVQQERSALAVSNGNIVVVWGGLDGDCGNYHGYVETVSESSGAAQQQWNDTPGGREGGMWAPSGAAVDGSGNIYVSTGNGSSSTITAYDYGDSVLKFSPTLTLQSWFAPGPPQQWASLNANDADLGSIGPSLLPNGLLFAIGKGGRGYILNQSSLPNNSNPGGGENFSAQVCHGTNGAAFGGLAVNGNTVYVPCADGIAAVSIDSASAFHTVWYETAHGGSAPIVAGGLVWTASMFGGNALYGLIPSTGQAAEGLPLPQTTNHFATPAAANGLLYVAAGTQLTAFSPRFAQNVGAPQTVVTPDGTQQLVFWKSTSSNQLTEAWYTGVWNGPAGFPQFGTLASAPGVAVTKDGSQQLVFWQGASGHLFEAWYALGSWHGPLDMTSSFLHGQGVPTSAPSVVTTPNGDQLVFWRGPDGHLWEAWYALNSWHGPADFSGLGRLASAPSAAVLPDNSQQLVFFQGLDNRLTEDWYALGSWHGPVEWTSLGTTNAAPSVAVTPDGSQQLVFYRSPAGHLLESWFAGSWNGPADWTSAAFGGQGPLASSPSATVTPDGSQQLVFWQGAGSSLWEGWYALGSWHGPVNWTG